jgi:chromosome partitioning protein
MPAGEMLMRLILNELELCRPAALRDALALRVLGVQASGQKRAKCAQARYATLSQAQPSQYRDQATPYFPFWATSVIIWLKMTRIYALANQKGGVGKTTTAVNLGAYLAAAGERVLLVDVDPQANATSCLGVDQQGLSHSTYDVLLNGTPAEDTILLSNHSRLKILPSKTALAGAEVELVGLIAREQRLRRALEPIAGDYDYILLDCPPSLGLLTINALVAAQNGVLIPVQCEYLALEGLGHLLRTIYLVRDNLNPKLTISGVVLTMFDARTNLSKQVVDEVRRFFPAYVFETVIPRTIRLSEAPSYGETILNYAPQTAGANAYQALAEELMERNE